MSHAADRQFVPDIVPPHVPSPVAVFAAVSVVVLMLLTAYGMCS